MNVQRRPLARRICRLEHRQRIARLRAASLEQNLAAERVLDAFAFVWWDEECVHVLPVLSRRLLVRQHALVTFPEHWPTRVARPRISCRAAILGRRGGTSTR